MALGYLAGRREKWLEEYPDFPEKLSEWLGKQDVSVGESVFWEFCGERKVDMGDDPTALIVLLLVRRRVLATSMLTLSVELHDRLEVLINKQTGPRFSCSMLADCSCEDECDWERFRTSRHDLADGVALDYRWLFLGDAATDAWPVQAAHQVRHSWVEAPTPLQDTRCCSAPGCARPFPPEPDSHAKNGWSIQLKLYRGRSVQKVTRLCDACREHCRRLSGSKEEKCRQNLLDFFCVEGCKCNGDVRATSCPVPVERAQTKRGLCIHARVVACTGI